MHKRRSAGAISLLAIFALVIGAAASIAPPVGPSAAATEAMTNQRESKEFQAVEPTSCDVNKTEADPQVKLFDSGRPAAACSQILIRLEKTAKESPTAPPAPTPSPSESAIPDPTPTSKPSPSDSGTPKPTVTPKPKVGEQPDVLLPKVGEQGLLLVTITSDENQTPGSAPLAVTLPPGLRFVDTPQGFSTEDASDPFGFQKTGAVGGDGNASAVSRGTISVNPGGAASVTFRIEVVAEGAGNIEASLEDPVGGQGANGTFEFTFSNAAASHVYLMPDSTFTAEPIKELAINQAPLYRSKSNLCAERKEPDSKGVCPGVDSLIESGFSEPKSLAPRAESSPPDVRPSGHVGVLATTCVTGRMVYADQSGAVWPSVNLPVVAVDDNPFDSDTLGSQVTDGDGRFNICFDNEEHSGLQGGTADVILKFKTQNQRWKVVNRCCADSGWTPGAYEITTPRRDNIRAGTVDYGIITASDPAFQRALHLYDEYNKAWQFANVNSPGSGNCWAASDCDQKVAMWSNGYSEVWPAYGPCAARGDAIVCLPANAPDWEPLVLHELGHNLMDDIYSGGIPDHDCPSPHFGDRSEEDRCAWTEGWPSWFSNAVMGAALDTNYGGQSAMFTPRPNMELSGWQNYLTLARGSNVEIRVAMALWDLGDSTNEAPYDRISLGDNAIWRAFLSGTSTTLPDFIARLGATQGVDFSESSPAMSTLYGNTIDLGGFVFRDPIATTWLDRPNPPVSPPSLSAIPPGSSASPVNTSNNHAFVWRRATRPSSCPDLIQVEDTWGRSTYYRSTANARRTFAYTDFRIDAFTDAATTQRVAGTPAVNLQQAVSLNLELPHNPRTIWLTTRGAAPAGETNGPMGGIAHGDPTQATLNHYRIRGSRCTSLQLGSATTFSETNLMNSGVFLRAGATYAISAVPLGAADVVKATNIELQVIRGRHCPQSKQASKCIFDAHALTSSDKGSWGENEQLTFTAPANGTYRILGDTASGEGVGWRVKIVRVKR